MKIKPNTTILFQGDSITDTGRNREITQPNHGAALGVGYANQIASRLLAERPRDNLRFFNRGISGNRVVDLYARWRVDAINLQPDIISILIGVNDTWHGFMYNNGVEVERYATVYRMLLEYTRQQLPNVQFVLCEPFVLPCGVVTKEWISEMDQRRAIVRDLATEAGAVFVPFQTVLTKALDQAPADYWAADGVHPTPAGHRLLADCWLQQVVTD
ncbi:MAG: SGNH/GDSL hydrolase family protein [Caldilineaceae bacterium]